ncbi:hypothetical protein JXB01_01445 [Candidatus Micrarchaeota archaeon]|nr:hypothetical protein [Candidatus Micrarchaeota archaeon]
MAGRRDRKDIIFDILRGIQERNGRVKPTHILYFGNLSTKQHKKYINELTEKGMIGSIEEGGQKYYVLTQKGAVFISEYKRIKEMSDALGI